MNFSISDKLLDRVASVIDWHRQEIKNPESSVLHIPEKDAWKTWDDNRLWCSFFFSIISPGGSKTAREYLKNIEDGRITFELHPEKLATLSDKERIKKIWDFGTGNNFLHKHLDRFFSRRGNIGDIRNFEYKLTNVFTVLMKNGFIEWFETLDKLTGEREKARALEFLPGSKLKVSRDFLNNIGMTSTLIPLDVHVLKEMKEVWGWTVPKATPSNRKKYEEIEDSVRIIAQKIKCRVVEIDKAIFLSANRWLPYERDQRPPNASIDQSFIQHFLR